jgi:hypothetical protein
MTALIHGEASPGAMAGLGTHVCVVSEDQPGEWRVADRYTDGVYGPFADESEALAVAFEGIRFSNRWEIHVLDQFGMLTGTYNYTEDSKPPRSSATRV